MSSMFAQTKKVYTRDVQYPDEILRAFNTTYPFVHLLKRFDNNEPIFPEKCIIEYIHDKGLWKASIHVSHWLYIKESIDKDFKQLTIKLSCYKYNKQKFTNDILNDIPFLKQMKLLLDVDKITSNNYTNYNSHIDIKFFRKNEEKSFLQIMIISGGYPESVPYDHSF